MWGAGSDRDSDGNSSREQRHLSTLFAAGELELWQALDLMDIIAPDLGGNERGLAADALVELSIADGWDNNDRVAAARSEEVFTIT